MKLNSKCMACQIRKQEAKIRHFNDEDRKKQYMEAIRQRFEHPKDDDCVPSISTELKKFYCSFWGVPMEDFTRIDLFVYNTIPICQLHFLLLCL